MSGYSRASHTLHSKQRQVYHILLPCGFAAFEVEEMAASGLQQLLYLTSQAARTSWFWSHYAIAARLAPQSASAPNQRVPTQRQVMEDLRALFERDWQNIDDGLYALPHDLVPRPYEGLRQSMRFFGDLASVNRRRRAGANQEVFEGPYKNKRPRYYLQNFHDQSGGYLSEASAQLYDYQVEVLFSGGADAMRRQALPPISQFLRSRNVRTCRLLDVGCGTGRFLSFVKDTHPRLCVTGLDLSGEYLAKASDNLKPWSRAECILANAEDMPFADNSCDIVTCHYLFHEVPARARRGIAKEIARVARPDSLVLFMDSIQPGDEPAYDGLLERFPQSFHEPYFRDYARENLETLFANVGLDTVSMTRAFFSRVMVLHPHPTALVHGPED